MKVKVEDLRTGKGGSEDSFQHRHAISTPVRLGLIALDILFLYAFGPSMTHWGQVPIRDVHFLRDAPGLK